MYQHFKVCMVMSSCVKQYSKPGRSLAGMQTYVDHITLILELLFWLALFISIVQTKPHYDRPWVIDSRRVATL